MEKRIKLKKVLLFTQFKTKLLFPIVLVVFFIPINAYCIKLSGTVLDGHTNTPIPFCNVYFSSAYTGTTTDISGNFSIDINNNSSDSLIFSCVGYRREKYSIANLIHSSQPIYVKLFPISINIEGVNVLEAKMKKRHRILGNYYVLDGKASKTVMPHLKGQELGVFIENSYVVYLKSINLQLRSKYSELVNTNKYEILVCQKKANGFEDVFPQPVCLTDSIVSGVYAGEPTEFEAKVNWLFDVVTIDVEYMNIRLDTDFLVMFRALENTKSNIEIRAGSTSAPIVQRNPEEDNYLIGNEHSGHYPCISVSVVELKPGRIRKSN